MSTLFFYASKILPGLLFPYPLFLIVTLLAFFRLRPGRLRQVYGILWLTIAVLSSYAFAAPALSSLEKRYAPLQIKDTPQADAIVVLSGMVTPLGPLKDRPEFSAAVDRILYGLDLLGARKAPVLLISGGSGLLSQMGTPEAEMLRQWAIAHGHPPAKILAESLSRNTAENAAETARIAKARGWKKIILVTSAFHMWRSDLCFRKQGLETIPFPLDYYVPSEFPGIEAFFPSPAAITISSIALKEYVGVLAYWFSGAI